MKQMSKEEIDSMMLDMSKKDIEWAKKMMEEALSSREFHFGKQHILVNYTDFEKLVRNFNAYDKCPRYVDKDHVIDIYLTHMGQAADHHLYEFIRKCNELSDDIKIHLHVCIYCADYQAYMNITLDLNLAGLRNWNVIEDHVGEHYRFNIDEAGIHTLDVTYQRYDVNGMNLLVCYTMRFVEVDYDEETKTFRPKKEEKERDKISG